MKKLLAITLAVLTISTALASPPNLFKIGTSKDTQSTHYIDLNSVKRNKNTVSVIYSMVFDKEAPGWQAIKPKLASAPKELRSEMVFDCSNKQMKFLSNAMYSKNGQLLQKETKETGYLPIEPGTVDETAYQKLCKK